MATRGPKPKFKPFQKTPSGNWYLYVPKQGILSLETDSSEIAAIKSADYANAHATSRGNIPVPIRDTNLNQIPSVLTPPAHATTQAPTGLPQPPDMVAQWINSTPVPASLPVESTNAAPIGPLPSQSASGLPFGSESPTLVNGLKTEKISKLIPIDKRERIATMLAGVVTELNVVGVALGVKLAGWKPDKEVDDDAKALLKQGWELQLIDLFVDHPPAPWMVIAGGSAAIAVGMIAGGERIKLEPKNAIKPPDAEIVGPK